MAIDAILEGRVLALLDLRAFSYDEIATKLRNEGHKISSSTVRRIDKCIGIRRDAIRSGRPIPKQKRQRKVRTEEYIKFVEERVKVLNPETQLRLSHLTSSSPRTVGRAIHEDLKLKTRLKPNGHKLEPRHIKNREANSLKLFNIIEEVGKEYMITLDEAWLYCNAHSQTKIIYVEAKGEMPPEAVYVKNERFDRKFMIVAVMTGRGVCKLRKVPDDVKVNQFYYSSEVLMSIIESDLVKLYPSKEEFSKLFIHHDKAPAHTSNWTQEFAIKIHQALGIRIIENNDIPVKGCDCSPLDFYGFGFLKRQLMKYEITNEEQLWVHANQIWNGISAQKCLDVFDNWQMRCLLIHLRKGAHIEGTSLKKYSRQYKENREEFIRMCLNQ